MKLVIISHTEHYQKDDGDIVGWGPTISEINHLTADFEEIYHIAFLHSGEVPPSSLPYSSSRVKFIPLKPVGGSGIINKLKILLSIPSVIYTVYKTLKRVDVFQLRTPTGIGVFLIPYLTLFSRKKGWYKYAGNWSQENPPLGYRVQRWMLKQQKRKVTINGYWPKQPKHCYSFENPCLTLKEREKGLEVIKTKNYGEQFAFCFVGRLEDDKGVQRIIDAFGKLKEIDKVTAIHFVGNGKKINHYKAECERLKLPAVFHGFLERNKVFEIYRASQFMLLPSTASEGFPKVIAEAMNFGCLPIVSKVSSIGQYINDNNGFIIVPCTSSQMLICLEDVLQAKPSSLKSKAIIGHKDVEGFTFKHYRKRIQEDILNSN